MGGSSQRLRWAISAREKAITKPIATDTTTRKTCCQNGSMYRWKLSTIQLGQKPLFSSHVPPVRLRVWSAARRRSLVIVHERVGPVGHLLGWRLQNVADQ